MILIAINGVSQSGKSTLADVIQDIFPEKKTIVRSSFSHFVREEITYCIHESPYEETIREIDIDILFSKDEYHISKLKELKILLKNYNNDPWDLEERPASDQNRKIQQYLGQNFRRGSDKNHWVKKHFEHYSYYMTNNFDDVLFIEESLRQPNEQEYIHHFGGITIKVIPLEAPTEAEKNNRNHEVEKIADSLVCDLTLNMKDYFTASVFGQFDFKVKLKKDILQIFLDKKSNI